MDVYLKGALLCHTVSWIINYRELAISSEYHSQCLLLFIDPLERKLRSALLTSLVILWPIQCRKETSFTTKLRLKSLMTLTYLGHNQNQNRENRNSTLPIREAVYEAYGLFPYHFFLCASLQLFLDFYRNVACSG